MQNLDKDLKKRLWLVFKELGVEATTLNHYELAERTGIETPEVWKAFITDPEIASYIKQEADLLLQVELRKLSSNASESKSVGQAQLINALTKVSDDATTKEGPVFIYTYVPLTPQQERAENVRREDFDIFLQQNKEQAGIEDKPEEF
ncbi:MAG: hypothetical protein PHY39_05380 [Endomicrobiaceae bacterium]|nr:hypothetical protein [Endomicrobiaceae bacterium]